MKIILLFCFTIALCVVKGQSFEGNWAGNVSGTNGSIQGEMTLKNQPNNQLSGELVVFGGNERDSYVLKGSYTANSASGKLTYKDGTIFDFVMNLNNGMIQQKISFHGQVILEGKFSKKSTANAITNTNSKPDNLYRDPKLVGKWVYSENYNSSGGFYGGSQSTIILNADGTVDDGGSTSYASGGGNSVMNNGGGNQTIAQLKALGAKWFTKGNIFCWRITVNGKTTDVENSKYYTENGALLMTDLQTGKKTLYQRR